MHSERIQVVAEGYEGWNRRDFDAMVERMATDVVWRTAVVEIYFHAKGRESGAEVKMDWVHVFTFEDDEVVEVAGYRETDEALAAEAIPSDAMAGASRIAR